MNDYLRRGWRPWILAISAGIVLAASVRATAQLTAYANGNNIEFSAGGGQVSSDDSYCVTAVVLDETERTNLGNGAPCRRAPLVTSTFYCNWTGTHTVRAYVYNPDGKQIELGKTTVTVTVPPGIGCSYPPRSVSFEITNAAPVKDRRVLISNLHTGPGGVPDHPYPHYQGLLARDAVIAVNLRTIYDAAATPGIPVTLRLIDPADASPYVAGGTGIVQPVPGSQSNDNLGALPTITGPGVSANADGTYSVVSGSEGYIQTELRLDPTARAGDNYRVMATATFEGGQTATATSADITVWKRLFVEKRNMHRRGSMLATDAPAGVTNVIVPSEPIASSGIDEFRRNDFVMLMHAPMWGQPKVPAQYYRGTYRITQRPQRFRARIPAPGPGLVTTNGTTAIVGTGTHFGRLHSGDVISIGGDDLYVTNVTDNTHLSVHRIPLTVATDIPYDVGDRNLIAGDYYFRLALDHALTESYQREPLVAPQSGVLTLNDAVVWLGPTSTYPGEYFDAGHSLLTAATSFPASYTDYIVLDPVGGAVSPIPRAILDVVAENTQRFVDRWFTLPSPYPVVTTDPDPLRHHKYRTPPNHQLLLIGDTNSANVTLKANGFLSKAILDEKAAVINRGTVEFAVADSGSPIYNADPDVVLSRTVAHEMTHQWLTNGIPAFGHLPDDHCLGTVAYDSPVAYPASGTPPPGLQFCLMTRTGTGLTMPQPGNPSLQIDMVQYHYRYASTSCHIVPNGTTWHSEYLAIRQRPDPWVP